MREPRPSARQRDILSFIVDQGGEYPAYWHEATMRAMVRRGWATRIDGPGCRRLLRVTVRGRWALRWDEALAEVGVVLT